MSDLIRIPKRFYTDHVERDLPAPEVVRVTSHHFFIQRGPADALRELLSDARHYAESGMFPDPELIGLVRSARATVRSIERALG